MKLRDIKGYEGKYMISDDGQVWSNYKKGFLKPSERSGGYLFVNLCKDGIQKHYNIHRLVAEAFIPNPNDLPIINHKDENKHNNCASNLEWCDYSYNNTYGNRIEKINQKISHKTYQYDLDGNLIAVWPSQQEASRQLNISSGNINDVIKGRRKTIHNFIFTDKEYSPLDNAKKKQRRKSAFKNQ